MCKRTQWQQMCEAMCRNPMELISITVQGESPCLKGFSQEAQKYRLLKKYSAKLSRWGLSLGVRIPKEMVEHYKLKQNKEVILVPEEEVIKLIPA